LVVDISNLESLVNNNTNLTPQEKNEINLIITLAYSSCNVCNSSMASALSDISLANSYLDLAKSYLEADDELEAWIYVNNADNKVQSAYTWIGYANNWLNQATSEYNSVSNLYNQYLND
jgi:Tfp pilus assembly protein PilF